MKKLTYLDCNATAPVRPQVISLMGEILAEPGNASSVHGAGRQARKRVEDARGQIARAFDVGPQQVIFNSGATEGNNTIIKGFAGQRILISAIEHASLIESGIKAELIPVTADGIVDLSALEQMLAQGPQAALVSVMMANNETGVIQPVAEICKLAKAHGALFHTDAVQALGRIEFTRESIGADFITVSSHKLGGPQGAGAIIMAPKAPLPKLIHGGGQERRQRAGTENIAAIAGFGLAVEMAMQEIGRYQALAGLREKIETTLTAGTNSLHIHGRNVARVANTTSFSLKGSTSETLLLALDLEGIAISSGSACSSGTVKPSHVLTAMGIDAEEAACALRVSLGWNTSEQDVEDFIAAWNKVRQRIFK